MGSNHTHFQWRDRDSETAMCWVTQPVRGRAENWKTETSIPIKSCMPTGKATTGPYTEEARNGIRQDQEGEQKL